MTLPAFARTEAFIGGQWRDAPHRFAVQDPATGAQIAQVVDGDAALAREAVDAAEIALAAWRAEPAKVRAAALLAWRDAILAEKEALARLITLEMGKPLAEARGEIDYGTAYLEWFAEEAKRADGEVLAGGPAGRRMLTLREPVGVVAVITPWNFPLAMLTRKAAPAIAAGCAVVAKPAEDTPLTALALAALAESSGLPVGLFNVLPGDRASAATITGAWLDDPRVRKLSFTGSTPVGKLLARSSADTLKRVSMELGGDAPFIVFDDADREVAVRALMNAKFRNAGQACIAANRVWVQSGIRETFETALLAAMAELTVGPGHEDGVRIGPLINDRALEKVERLVVDALAHGAETPIGGARLDRPGAFYPPTLLTGVTDAMACAGEEIFGPVIALSTFDDETALVAELNRSPYGLAAYFCTRDMARVWRLSDQLQVGMVGVNEGAISSEVAPFGGVKMSGYGREGSRHGLGDYQSIKYVCLGGV
jgi:succinate-semialdehyde dehydrogenase/glutarate-semialdehyde dehydrogenase